MTPRTDTATSTAVNRAIALAPEHGTFRAARFLYGYGVPFDVALRVLTRPWARR